MKDLVLLVADNSMRMTLKGVLERPESLGIRPIQVEYRVHPNRDGGVRTTGPETIATEHGRFHHSVLLVDFEGSGTDKKNGLDLEQTLNQRLRQLWGEAAKAIVIEPELDVWMWGSDNALQEVFDWPLAIGVRDWLEQKGFHFNPQTQKPFRPKEALEALVQIHRKPNSSALYFQIVQKISLSRCHDPAFGRLASLLRNWFPRP